MSRPLLIAVFGPLAGLLFGLWLFGIFQSVPPHWLIYSSAPSTIFTNPEPARMIFLVLLAFLPIAFFFWIDVWQLRKRFPLFDIPGMAMMVAVSKRGVITLFTIVLMWSSAIGVVWYAAAPWDSYLIRIVGVTTGLFLLYILMPPVAIFLGASKSSGDVLIMARCYLLPYRVLVLIDRIMFDESLMDSSHDNLRTVPRANWQKTVGKLVEFAPIVFIDAREASDAVCCEIRYMSHPDRVGKAIFIVNENGLAPGITRAGIDPRGSSLGCCTANKLPRIISEFRKTGSVMRPKYGTTRRPWEV